MEGFVDVFVSNEVRGILNTLRLRQNGRHSADDIPKCVFLYQNCILFQISLKFIFIGPINNKLALVQIMAWFRKGNKSVSKLIMVWLDDIHMRHLTLIG